MAPTGLTTQQYTLFATLYSLSASSSPHRHTQSSIAYAITDPVICNNRLGPGKRYAISERLTDLRFFATTNNRWAFEYALKRLWMSILCPTHGSREGTEAVPYAWVEDGAAWRTVKEGCMRDDGGEGGGGGGVDVGNDAPSTPVVAARHKKRSSGGSGRGGGDDDDVDDHNDRKEPEVDSGRRGKRRKTGLDGGGTNRQIRKSGHQQKKTGISIATGTGPRKPERKSSASLRAQDLGDPFVTPPRGTASSRPAAADVGTAGSWQLPPLTSTTRTSSSTLSDWQSPSSSTSPSTDDPSLTTTLSAMRSSQSSTSSALLLTEPVPSLPNEEASSHSSNTSPLSQNPHSAPPDSTTTHSNVDSSDFDFGNFDFGNSDLGNFDFSNFGLHHTATAPALPTTGEEIPTTAPPPMTLPCPFCNTPPDASSCRVTGICWQCDIQLDTRLAADPVAAVAAGF